MANPRFDAIVLGVGGMGSASLFELARRPDWFRLSLLLINLAVLAYLVWLLQRKKKAELVAEEQ